MSSSDKNYCVSGQNASKWSISTGKVDAKGLSNFSLKEIGFNYKFENVYFGVDPNERIFRGDCGRDQYVDFITERQNSENKATVLDFTRE